MCFGFGVMTVVLCNMLNIRHIKQLPNLIYAQYIISWQEGDLAFSTHYSNN